jgi:hypothetical protein
MPDFDKLFATIKERPINYNGKFLIRSDQSLVSDGDILIASIEETNSDRLQGFSIDITGYCEMDGKTYKSGKGVRMLFWENSMPKQIKLKVFTKKNFVRIENIWEQTNSYLMEAPSGEIIKKESKSVEYWHGGAAMIVEEIENGRRYRCNDGYPDENFDDIVFTVRKASH